MKKEFQKIELLEEKLGVKFKVDPTLDNFSKAVPDKMKKSEAVLANSKFNL